MVNTVLNLFHNRNVPNPNNQLVRHSDNIPAEIESNLEKACKQIDLTSDSFAESFPNYDPNADAYPIKIFNEVYKYFRGIPSVKQNEIAEQQISSNLTQKLETEDLILDSQSETVSEAILLDNTQLVVYPTKFIAAGLLYRTVVNTYARTMYPMSHLSSFTNEAPKKLWLAQRKKHITIFMLLYAPAITIGLFKSCNSSLFEAIQIGIHKPIGETSASIFTLFLTIKKKIKKNTINYKYKFYTNSKYYKIIKFILLFLVIIFCLYDFDYLIKIVSKISYSQILCTTIILGSLYLFYLFLNIYVIFLFIKNKIKIPRYIPSFLYKWLLTRKKISTFEPAEIRAFTDLYLRDIIFNIIALTFTIIIYLLIN